jgi:sugar phosphate isomerase/epimerase
LGLTLDPSYYTCGRYANQSYDQVFPYVYHTHLRDTTPSELQVQIGLGEIDYSRIIGQLRRYNYTRALSVEILPSLLGGHDRALELRKIRMLLETLL